MDKQQDAIKRILNGESIFLTGSGGVGKSWVIQQIVDDSTVLCAPSGIAALNIGGITCHRAFGLPLGIPIESDYYTTSPKVSRLFQGKAVKRIVIDEVGMLRRDYLTVVSRKLQRIRGNDKPFGGIQMVMVGDFFQVEPILRQDEQQYFEFDSKFSFTSPLWDFPTVELTDVKRQSNKRQILMLNSIRRKDKYYKKALEYIQNECKPYELNEHVLHLCCYNKDANNINKTHYSNIAGVERTFKATVPLNWGAERPVDEVLNLKIGTRVIICQNSPDELYVNGERGVIIGYEVLEDKTEAIMVEKDNGDVVPVVRANWEKFSYTKRKKILGEGEEVVKNVDAIYSQYPLKYGWAVSIHKSQSLTLDDVAIDVGTGCFAAGQAYVGLSRIRDLTNLSFVRPMLPEDIIVRKEVQDFMRGGV